METSSLTFKTIKNASWNILGYVWPFIFAIFITPIIVFKVGLSVYGNYIFINTLISLASLLDLGIGVATIKYVIEHHSRNEKEELKKTIYSMNWLFLIIGIVGCLAIIFIGVFGSTLLHINSVGNASTITLFVIGGITFFIASLNGLGNCTLTALQRYDIINKINIVSITLSSLSLLAIVTLGYGIREMLISQLFFAIIFLFVLNRSARKIFPEAQFKLRWYNHYVIRSYKFALASVMASVSNVALSSLDRLIIPIFIGASSLTYYSLPGNLTGKIPGITNTLSSILFPLTASLSSIGDKERIKTTYVRSFRLLLIFASAIAFSTIFLARPILTYWLSAEFAEKSSGVLIILAITNLILALVGPLYNFLLGLGKLRLISIISIIMAAINVVLLLILLPRYGITGAAFAYLLALFPVGYLFYVAEKKYIGLEDRGKYYLTEGFRICFVAILCFILDYYIFGRLISDKISMIAVFGLAIIIFLSMYRLLGFFESEDIRDAQNFAKLVVQKIRRI